MSKWRLKAFDECRDRTNPNIPDALGNVSYHSKMTDKQLYSLAQYMTSNQISLRTLLTYDGMENIADDVLCRWLRPSELQRLSVIMKQDTLRIYRGTLKLQLEPDTTPGRFVGILGENLVALTRKHNLLYAWYHNSTKNLVLYSLKKSDINNAFGDSILENFKVETVVEENIGKADWGKIGQITNIRTYANVVRGKPATTTKAARAPRSAVATRANASTSQSRKTTKTVASKKPSSKTKKTFVNSRTYANVVMDKPRASRAI